MNKKHLFLTLLIIGTACWGISFPVTKMAVTGVSQPIFLLYRFGLATLVLAIVFFRQLKKTTKKSFIGGVLLSIPLTAAIYFQTWGLQHTSASQCAFIAGMTVVVVPILKWLVYRKTVAAKIWLAGLVALAGLFVISIKGSLTIGLGDLFTIIGAIGFAGYLIQVERYSATGNDIIPTIVPMFLTCTVIMLGFALSDTRASWLPDKPTFWPGIAYCALLSTAFMYTVSNISQRYIAAEKVAIIYLFEPVFAAVAAYFLLDETLSWRLAVGGTLIVAGTIISEIRSRRPGIKPLSPAPAIE
ncbi:DMT family transporter [Paraflavitalea pollutisoli]|uniref:DMT family transporter n=1 Tax=Paraflavitalea pollutisoli TaxID=3034143 RepID=UPI0023EB0683|nr:DMT family transporter [Paraflavitalea sp. H1-2-19X]